MKPCRWCARVHREPARASLGRQGSGEARSTGEAGSCRRREGPQFERNVGKGTGTKETGASLQAPVTVRKLQRALHAKAKGAPGCREERERGELAEAVEAVAPVAELEAPGEVGEGRALPGWTTVAEPRSGTPGSAAGAAFRGRRHDLEREPSAGNPHAGFDERGEETWSRWRLRHRHQGESRRQQLLPLTSTSAPLLDFTLRPPGRPCAGKEGLLEWPERRLSFLKREGWGSGSGNWCGTCRPALTTRKRCGKY